MQRVSYKLLFLLALCWHLSAHSADYAQKLENFNTNGTHYDEVIPYLIEGDTIRFKEGKFKLGPFLGEGSLTRVFAINDIYAIRLPKRTLFKNTICNSVNAFQKIRHTELFIAQMIPELSSRSCDFAIVERLTIKFNFADYLDYLDSISRGLNPKLNLGEIAGVIAREEKTKNLLSEYVRFAESTYQLTSLSNDFRAEQLGWDGERWILLDWTDSFDFYDLSRRKVSIALPQFHPTHPGLPEETEAELYQKIQKRRVQMVGQSCTQLLY